MSNFGLIRRDLAAGNKIRLGFTSYVIIFVVSLVISAYVFLRMSGYGPTMLDTSEPKEDPNAIPSNVDTLSDTFSNWRENTMSADGVAVPQYDEGINKAKDVLSTQTAVFTSLTPSNLGQGSVFTSDSLDMEKLEQLSGDDGGLYIKSNFSVFSLNVPAGTVLSGKRNTSYIVGDDLKLYQVMQGGKRVPVAVAPKFKLWDESKKFYVVTNNLQLRLHTPGPKGSFTGPDGKMYNILSSGDIEAADSQEIVPYVNGQGEFVGSDNRKYVAMQGLLFSATDKNASFSKGVLQGRGYFKGPDGKTYMLGEDGKIYATGSDGKLYATNIGGSGMFIGPDGSTYFKDENGDIRKILGGGENGVAQKTNLSHGYFVGPDGKRYYSDDKGNIYTIDEKGNLVPAKIGGSGIFRGPDGKLYRIGKDGNITKVTDNPTVDAKAKGKFLVGTDGKKYFVDKDGKTFLVDENGNLIPAVLPAGTYKDAEGNLFSVDNQGSVTSLSDKLPTGTYTDANGKQYYVDEKGEIYAINPDGSLKKVESLPEGTVLTNSKGSSYKVGRDGRMKRQGIEALPSGYFTGADGKTYFKGKDGKLYTVDKNGNLTPVEKLPQGTFIGPDGQMYTVDDNGNVTKLSNNKKTKVAEGYFYGPDGKMYYSDKTGKLYEVDSSGNLKAVERLPQGTFVAPDGKQYVVDANGNISAVAPEKEEAQSNDQQLQFGTAETYFAPVDYVPVGQPKKTSVSVNVSENLENFRDGKKDFEPVSAAKEVQGGRVYTMSADAIKQKTQTKRSNLTPPTEEEQHEKFMPIGTRIPFYLLSHIATNLERGSLIEGVVAENVFFHKAAIPAGTRLYGSVGNVGSNNRISLTFNMLQYPNGKSISLSADTYDVNMQFGLEAYYTPAPLWATALRFANVSAIFAMSQNTKQAKDSGESLGDMSEVTSYLEDTVDEIIHKQEGYYTIPAGTPGVLMLTANLDLSKIEYSGGNKVAAKSASLLNDADRLKRMKDNAEAAYQQQLINAAANGQIIDTTINAKGETQLKIKEERNIPSVSQMVQEANNAPRRSQRSSSPVGHPQESNVDLSKAFK